MSTKALKSQNSLSYEPRKSFSAHLDELRSRFGWVIIFFILTSALAYTFRDTLINIVMKPLADEKLIYLTPGGGFNFIFQVTIYAGILVTAPLLIYQLYRFVSPALPLKAQRKSAIFVLASFALMLAGVAFGYFVGIPSALSFLTTFAEAYVSPSLTAESYLAFVAAYLFGLGLLFQLPLLLITWNWISPIKPGGLLNSQRFVIIFSFIAAAIITPTPDVVNQMLVAGPIIGVYQLGVISVFIINRPHRKSHKAERPAVLVQQPLEDAPVPQRSTPTSALASTAPIQTRHPRRAMDIMPKARAPSRVGNRPLAATSGRIQQFSGRSVDGLSRSALSQRSHHRAASSQTARHFKSTNATPVPKAAGSGSDYRFLSVDGFPLMAKS